MTTKNIIKITKKVMTKTQFFKEIKYQHNSIRKIDGVNIAKVDWLDNPWLIVENEDTWEDVSKAGFVPILYFRTSEELYKRIYKPNQ